MPRVTFPQVNKTFEAAEGFSILEVALNNDIDLEHNCGGNCACSTCHVIVHEGLESCNEATEAELDDYRFEHTHKPGRNALKRKAERDL